jgi:phosphohistidine phosphatase
MKTIYLVRHAKSSWEDPKLADFKRPLNTRGKKDAPFMGVQLNNKQIEPDLILASPAKRAKKTAQAIAEKISYPAKNILFKDEFYEASEKTLLDIIKKIDERFDSVMVFAHNPGLTQLNNLISNNYIENIPTCGVVALECDKEWSDVGKNSCKLLFFDYPKKYLR